MKQKILKQSKVPNTCYNCFHQMCFQGLSLITGSGSCRMHIDEGGEDRGHCSLCYYWLLSTLCVCIIWKDTHYPTLQADQQYNVILCACCSKSIFRNKACVSLIWVWTILAKAWSVTKQLQQNTYRQVLIFGRHYSPYILHIQMQKLL